MPNLPNLSGSNISDTYTRVLHTDGSKIYDGTGSVVLGSVELSSLQTMNNNTISNADWTYVASMDQHVNQGAAPIFDSVRVSNNYDFKVGEDNIEGMGYSGGKIQFANAINAAVNIDSPYYKSGDSNALGLSSGVMKVSEDYPIVLNNQSTTCTDLTGSGILKFGTLGQQQLHTLYGKLKVVSSDITIGDGHISASGDMRATGSIYALTGSFGTGTTTITDSINTTGAITATGNIEGNALSGKTVQAEEIVARSGKTEITLGKVDERVTAILNGDLRIKGSDMFIGSGSISASGDILTTGSFIAGGNVSAGVNGTGSFDHIITTTGSIEFRDGDTVVGFLKMTSDGLEEQDNNRGSKPRIAHQLRRHGTVLAPKIGGVSFNGTAANISLPGVDTDGTQNTSGRAATATLAAEATILENSRRVGGVPFNGSADINLPGVNTAGNQDTTGNAGTATTLETARTIGGVSFDGSKNITPKSHLGSNNTIRVFPTDFFYNRNIQYSPGIKWAYLTLNEGVEEGTAYYNMQLPVGAQLLGITPFGSSFASISARHIDRCGAWVRPAISFLYKATATTQVPCDCSDMPEWTVNPLVKNNAYLQGVDNYLVIGITLNGEKAQFASLTLTYI